ncbi:MAG: hypothetical protein AB8G11_09705 [Saprospiraceae bacterium]
MAEKKTNKETSNKLEQTKIAEPKATPKSTKPKIKTEKHELLEDVKLGNRTIKKGEKYPLTEKGAKYFKSKNYIK